MLAVELEFLQDPILKALHLLNTLAQASRHPKGGCTSRLCRRHQQGRGSRRLRGTYLCCVLLSASCSAPGWAGWAGASEDTLACVVQ